MLTLLPTLEGAVLTPRSNVCDRIGGNMGNLMDLLLSLTEAQQHVGPAEALAVDDAPTILDHFQLHLRALMKKPDVTRPLLKSLGLFENTDEQVMALAGLRAKMLPAEMEDVGSGVTSALEQRAAKHFVPTRRYIRKANEGKIHSSCLAKVL